MTILIGVAWLGGCKRPPAEDAAAFVEQTNLGKARFENRQFTEALAAFEAARRATPSEPAGRFNVALALMQFHGRRGEAVPLLEEASRVEPDSAAVLYLLGLCHKDLGRVDEAVAALERSVRIDADVDAARYHLAAAYQAAGRLDDAYQQFRECIRLNPSHRNAHYGLSQLAQRLGKQDEAQRALAIFRKLPADSLEQSVQQALLERCRHTQVRMPFSVARPAAGVAVRFTDVTTESGLLDAAPTSSSPERDAGRAATACVFDADGGGRWDLLWPAEGGRGALMRNVHGTQPPSAVPSAARWFAGDEIASMPTPDEVAACVVADLGNDGIDDAFTTGPRGSRWLRRVRFRRVDDVPGLTGSSRLEAAGPQVEGAAGGLVVPLDFDGDRRSDLFVTDASGRARLLRNTSRATPAEGDRATVRAAFADVTAAWRLPDIGIVTVCVAARLDGDDRTDLVIAGPAGCRVLLNDGGASFRDVSAGAPIGPGVVNGLHAADVDGDGDLDLLVALDAARPQLLLNDGGARFADATRATGLPERVPDLHRVIACDLNGDGLPDLVMVRESDRAGPTERCIVAWGVGPGRFTPPPSAAPVRPIDEPDPEIRSGRVAVVTVGGPPGSRPGMESGDGPQTVFLAGRIGGTLWQDGRVVEPHPDIRGIEARDAAILDFDSDGQPDLLLAGRYAPFGDQRFPRPPRLLRRLPDGHGWQDVSDLTGLDVAAAPDVRSVAVADYDGDGDADLVIGYPDRAPVFLEHDPTEPLVPITTATGLADVNGRDAVPVDYDVDGDLDLFVARDGGGLSLLRNNGDGTFTDEFAEKPDLRRDGMTFDRVAAADFAIDDAPDLIAAGPVGTAILINHREGTFAPPTPPADLWSPATCVAVDDFDNDGFPDAVLGGADTFTIRGGRDMAPIIVPAPGARPTDIRPFDFDNDGWTDLMIVSGAAALDTPPPPLQLWRNLGPDGWQSAGAATGVDRIAVDGRRALTADFDADGDTDVLVLASDGRPLLLRNDGGNANRQLKLALTGTKSNRNAIGVHVDVRAGTFRAARVVTGPCVEIGVGPHDRLDSVRAAWTNGIVHNEVGVSVSHEQSVAVAEPQVAAGSCPYLYAWNGEGFSFITDLLGNSPVGLSFARGQFLPADPTEIVRIGDVREYPPRDGRFILQATDELREIFYLDHAELLVVDRPPDVEVHSNDKLAPPPFAPSRLIPLRSMQLPARAVDHLGNDRTAAVRAIDCVFTDPGRPDVRQHRGTCPPHAVTVEFNRIDASAPHVLALTGWLQYGDASVNVALSQSADAVVIPPRLEARVAHGEFVPIDVVVGMPAGKTKTILVDLAGKLPAETTALRLTTTFEIRWDRIALFERADDAVMTIRRLPVETADLHFRGFGAIYPHATNAPYTPDYEPAAPRPPWRVVMSGWCTRYGDVRELLTAADDRYAILNSGDEVTLTFDAAGLPPTPDGMTRELFFHSTGWDKDMDHNIRAGTTVEPLPYLGMDDQAYAADGRPTPPELADWAAEYDTRFVPADRFRDD